MTPDRQGRPCVAESSHHVGEVLGAHVLHRRPSEDTLADLAVGVDGRHLRDLEALVVPSPPELPEAVDAPDGRVDHGLGGVRGVVPDGIALRVVKLQQQLVRSVWHWGEIRQLGSQPLRIPLATGESDDSVHRRSSQPGPTIRLRL